MSQSNWRVKVDKKFEAFTYFITTHKIKTLFILLFFIIALASNIPKITIDTSTEGFLYKDDPQIVAYDAFRNQFGRDEKIIIAIKSPDIFNKAFLKKLFALHDEIKNTLPYVKSVDSLKNARVTTGDQERLIVEDLFPSGIPQDEKRLQSIKAYAQKSDIYKNMYLNEEANFTTILITTQTYSSIGEKKSTDSEHEDLEGGFDEDLSEGFDEGEEPQAASQDFITAKETNELINKLKPLLKKYQSDDFKIYTAGSPIVTQSLQETLMKDMAKFIFLVIFTIGALLYFMFKRPSGIILPLILVAMSLAATAGSMALLGYPITSMTQILPSLLLAVGVGASVHLLAVFYKKFDHTHDKQASIAYAMGHSGLAIVMTSLTTAASLSSFMISDIAPVASLGMFASIGVLIELVMTLVFIPVMLSLLPLKPKKEGSDSHKLLDGVMLWIADVSIRYKKSITALSLIILVGSLGFISQMHFSHNPLQWFKEGNPIRVNTETIDHEMRGSISIEVVLDTKKENGIYDPKFLNTLESMEHKVLNYKDKHLFIGKITSVDDLLKEINKALHENRDAFYTIPQDKELIAQEFVLFENSGSDDLEDIVDSRFSKTRMSIKAPWIDSTEYVHVITFIKTELHKAFGDDIDISVTGMIPILASTITQSISSSIDSYLIAFSVIGLLMIILIGSFKLGFLSMLPNLTPIMFGVAFMGLFHIPIDLFTVLIGAIAIGLVVDDTIHYMHNFKRYYIIHGDVDEAIRLTLMSSGRAIFITSIVLSAGFFVFMFASMNNLFNFGLVTGVTVLVAMLTNLFLSGSLMKLFIKEHECLDENSCPPNSIKG